MTTEIVDQSAEDAKAISFSTVVDALPATVFAMLTDTSAHSKFDGSGTVKGARGGKTLTAVGDRFGMKMRLGVPYPITNTVVEFEQDRLIAWRHMGRHRWRYELEPVEGGTRVTETFDWSRAPGGFLYGPLGFIDAHRKSIPATLKRLQSLFSD